MEVARWGSFSMVGRGERKHRKPRMNRALRPGAFRCACRRTCVLLVGNRLIDVDSGAARARLVKPRRRTWHLLPRFCTLWRFICYYSFLYIPAFRVSDKLSRTMVLIYFDMRRLAALLFTNSTVAYPERMHPCRIFVGV